MAEIKKLFTQVFNKYAPISPRILEILFPLFDIYTIENGNETSLDFYFGESIIVLNFCWTINNRSILTVLAQTKSIVAEIDATVFRNIRNEYTEISELSSSVIMRLYKSKLQKQIFHATKSGKGKLEQLRKDFPGIENQIPLPYIASYLGMTNVSLSRLRNPK